MNLDPENGTLLWNLLLIQIQVRSKCDWEQRKPNRG